MKLIDNINDLLGDDIKQSVQPGARLKIAASCFSIYAYEALKRELESVESFEFIFTSPTFMPGGSDRRCQEGAARIPHPQIPV